MSESDVEKVLVISRALFDRLGAFDGFAADVLGYMPEILKPENNYFLARPDAENDPSHKQIIPYCIFMYEGKILRYIRGGDSGEKRLANKASIGIGGHVNDLDKEQEHFDETAYENAVRREITEELILKSDFVHRPVGLINDDSSEVGAVHLGVVHLVELGSPDVESGESAIASPEFLSLDELRGERDNLESWSQIVVDAWERINTETKNP
ncbi:MAG: hypothetical protein ACK5NG_00415 [Chthoniobacterales bacterium]